MRPNLQFLVDLVTFTEEMLNEKLHFLCSMCGPECRNIPAIACICLYKTYSRKCNFSIKASTSACFTQLLLTPMFFITPRATSIFPRHSEFEMIFQQSEHTLFDEILRVDSARAVFRTVSPSH